MASIWQTRVEESAGSCQPGLLKPTLNSYSWRVKYTLRSIAVSWLTALCRGRRWRFSCDLGKRPQAVSHRHRLRKLF
jgi:hypothetical protein